MLFNISFDSSVSSAPTGFVSTVNAVAQFFENTFSDNVTVNVSVGFGEVGGQTVTALGESETFLNTYTYSQVRSGLIGDAKTADDSSAANSLPSASPLSGATYWVPRAEAKALGLLGASSNTDGFVGFSSASNLFDYDRSNGITAGQYDFFGVVAHELTEVMGRQLMTSATFGGHANSLEPMDLFHYSAAGVRSFTGTQAGYFSPDGGSTNLDNFNTNSGGDFGDWASSAGNDAFLAFGRSGVVSAVTEADLRVMDAIGWDRTTSSPPPTDDYADSISDTTAPFGQVAVNGSSTGALEVTGDRDWFRVQLTAGMSYVFDLMGAQTGAGTLSDPYLRLHDSSGALVAQNDDIVTGTDLDSELTYAPAATGTYYIEAGAFNDGAIGTYRASVTAHAVALNLTGTSGPDVLVGGPADDALSGLGGNDTLDGGPGNDTMAGGPGDDLYYVRDAGDVVVENPGEGSDTIIAYVTYTLPANVEAIYTVAGTGATGNGGDNLLDGAFASSGQTLDGQGGNDVIYGTFFNDTLIGGAGSDALYDIGGNDTMQGGAGDDAYFVNSTADVVQENPGEGNDTVYASVNFTLPDNVEVLESYGSATRGDGNDDANVLLGVASDHGLTLDGHGGNDVIYGSNFDDALIGGAGDDLLWGLGGNDTMQGGTGNDTYIVEQAGDVVQENPGEGNDTIYASVNITLPANVENLFVYGGATSGSGNSADNLIVNEFITSGVTLTGGGGNDTFVFIPGTAQGSTITDFVGNGASAGDLLEFAAYGAGATFTNIDATHWQVNYNGGASHDVITFSNAAAIDPSDVLFV